MVFGGSAIINLCPRYLKPLVGWVVSCIANRHRAICKKIALPIVEERLKLSSMKELGATHGQESPVCYMKNFY